jgi:hypothetical protein
MGVSEDQSFVSVVSMQQDARIALLHQGVAVIEEGAR